MLLKRAERAAALAVLGFSAAVAAAGYRLAKRQAAYRAKQAAILFGKDTEDENGLVWPEEASWEDETDGEEMKSAGGENEEKDD